MIRVDVSVAEMDPESTGADLARVWLVATPRRFVSAPRLGVRHARTDLPFPLDVPEGGTP